MSRDDEEINRLKKHLGARFEVKDLGAVKHCLGLEFSREESTVTIRQRGYIFDVLEKFGMSECRPVGTPMEPGVKLSVEEDTKTGREDFQVPYRELIGSLMYLSVGTRPDIAHAVSSLNQFNDCHTKTHWEAAKRVLRYLKETCDLGIVFRRSDVVPTIYTDADWGGCSIDRKSYTGFVLVVGGGAVSWESRKQQTVALSSTEAEYMALSEATKEAIYMTRLLKDIGVNLKNIVLKSDSLGAQKLAANPIHHARTKHIDIRHHFVRGAMKEGAVVTQYTPTSEMAADFLTKSLPKPKHEHCIRLLGLEAIP